MKIKPSTALYMVDEWDLWGEYDREEGFCVDRFEVGKDHTVIFYNFPEPQQIPEALLWNFGFPGAKCIPEVGHRQDC